MNFSEWNNTSVGNFIYILNATIKNKGETNAVAKKCMRIIFKYGIWSYNHFNKICVNNENQIASCAA